MKSVEILRETWWVKGFEYINSDINTKAAAIMVVKAAEDTGWLNTEMPKVAQEVLFDKGLLDPSIVETGEADYCKWVSEQDWVFRHSFIYPGADGTVYLECTGLDARVDIFLNGDLITRHYSMFLPERIELTGYKALFTPKLFIPHLALH